MCVIRIIRFIGGKVMGRSEREEHLCQAFLNAIKEIGIDEFKKCSFFGRNTCK